MGMYVEGRGTVEKLNEDRRKVVDRVGYQFSV